jgi:integrase
MIARLSPGVQPVGPLDHHAGHEGDRGSRRRGGAARRLRHTLATRLVRDHGRDLALVADVLGHADAKTTRRHARSELEDRRTALEALDR